MKKKRRNRAKARPASKVLTPDRNSQYDSVRTVRAITYISFRTVVLVRRLIDPYLWDRVHYLSPAEPVPLYRDRSANTVILPPLSKKIRPES